MPHKFRLAYFAHTLRSDWNNGNAHFLRGLMRAMIEFGHDITIYEPEREWSIDNLRSEAMGEDSLETFLRVYAELDIRTYSPEQSTELWHQRLRNTEIVILHEWNPPRLANMLLDLRELVGYKLLFHDTHHRASSSPQQIELFGLQRFDGIVAFGDALRSIYQNRFGLKQVWTLHEGADITVFHPRPEIARKSELVWIGNWGEGERAAELQQFLITPAAALKPIAATRVYGVRYPAEGLAALQSAGVQYGGYLANLNAPAIFAAARVTVHVPRQHYAAEMTGIPTIRVFEALACGIPLVSAPWQDTDCLFGEGDFRWASNSSEMIAALRDLLVDTVAAKEQAARGLATIAARHTCAHRASELTAICEEVLA